MQRPDNIYKQIKANEGVIDKAEWIEGDEQAFAHCKKILDLREVNRNRVAIELYVTPIIPSFPSLLIVDDDELLFTIPQKKVNTKDETRKKLDPIVTAGVLHFTDNSQSRQEIIQPFKEIMATLTSNADTDIGETQIISTVKKFDHNVEFMKWYNYGDQH